MPALGALIHIVLPSFLYSLEVLHLLRVLASDGVMDLGARGGCKEQEERTLNSIQQGPASLSTRKSNTSGEQCTTALLSNTKRPRSHSIYLLASGRMALLPEKSRGASQNNPEGTGTQQASWVPQQPAEKALSFYWIHININASIRPVSHSLQ